MSERAFWRFLALSVRLPFAFGMPLWRALWLAAWGGSGSSGLATSAFETAALTA